MRSSFSRRNDPSSSSRNRSGRPFSSHLPGPDRSNPPFVAITRSFGYGCSASAISSSLTCGPYDSAVSIRLTPSSIAWRSTASASRLSFGGPQTPSPVMRIAPKPRRFTVRSPPRVKVVDRIALMRKSVAIAAVLLAFTISAKEKPQPPFNVVEASLSDMQAALKSGRVTSHELVQQYLTRIATYEDKLHAAITVNPNALKETDERDREKAAGKVRGPLHGIPIALKDNIQTTDMPTTGGALAFDGLVPPYEATLTKNLRDAGAIIIAKTQMTELANWISGAGMPNNYNAENGYGMNPYDPRRDPREATNDGRPALNTGGSSSGTGTASSFWAANVGT